MNAPSLPEGASATTHGGVTYAFGEFTLETGSRSLRRSDGAEVALPSRAFDALLYLIEHRHRLVQKNELVESVWHDVVVTDDSLIHAISVLRRTLADDPNQPRYVQTVPRRGYRFVAPVEIGATAAAALTPAADLPAQAPAAPAPRPRARVEPWQIVAAAALLVAVAGTALWTAGGFHRETEDRRTARAVRLFQPPPPGTAIVSGGVLSPDGQSLAFVARDNDSGRSSLWIRTLHSSDMKPLENTDGASKPFWAPDSRRLGFFANGKLKVLTVDDAAGEPLALAEAGIAAAGATWAPDDTILFANWAKGLYAVSARGGEPVEVATLDRAQRDIAWSWPQFLPDGRHYLYQVVSLDAARTGTYVGDLDARRSIRVLDTESPAVFAPPRHVLHIQRDLLIAEEFDPKTLQLTGRATVLARGVSPPSPPEENIASAAGDLIAYRQGVHRQQLAWVSRTGDVVGTVPMPAEVFNPRVSPDGSHLLATSSVTTNPGLWLASLSHAEFERLEADAIAPLWSPDGARIAFTAHGGFDLLIRSTTNGSPTPLITGGAVKILNDWSPDGAHIVFSQLDDRTKMDLWGIRVADGTEFPILTTPYNEMQARISPDGKWIAYVSDESGALEVYVQRYPELGQRLKVSTGGGGQPQWRRDQSEIFYIAPDHMLVAVPIDLGREAALGTARRLFRAPVTRGPDNARDNYAATPDGGKFLVDGSIGSGSDAAITVVVNWPAETGAAPEPRALE
ncbi:MAG TPA: winged helix-turn-helix domain-containing protein [Gammaproteobacteria bacterium]|jgi:DNA-binding winged helix-turn-helix (wHTH) protein/Tol biopolymer transport system component|nr:winged helix-turn-helix domain-containing protein [Gammaproteobacteria bacterium]